MKSIFRTRRFSSAGSWGSWISAGSRKRLMAASPSPRESFHLLAVAVVDGEIGETVSWWTVPASLLFSASGLPVGDGLAPLLKRIVSGFSIAERRDGQEQAFPSAAKMAGQGRRRVTAEKRNSGISRAAKKQRRKRGRQNRMSGGLCASKRLGCMHMVPCRAESRRMDVVLLAGRSAAQYAQVGLGGALIR